MTEHDLLCLITAILFAANREDLREDDPLSEIRECARYAEDILEEVDKLSEPAEEENVEVIPPRRSSQKKDSHK